MQLKRLVFFTLLAIGGSFHLPAIELDNLLDCTTGYQRHNFHTAVNLFDPEGAHFGVNHLVVRNLHVWTAGVEGRLCIPGCEQIYTRFNADYGWVISPGKYWELFANGEGRSESSGQAKSGSIVDTTLGLGYLFNLVEVGVAPIAGWSYNYQQMKMAKVFQDGVENDNLKSLKSSSHWNGPWVGVDLFYDTLFTCYGNLSLEGGYEYHWANWSSSWKLKGADRYNGDFSDRRHSKDGHGQVGYLYTRWNFASCWNVGLLFKYQYWRAHTGRVHPAHGSLEQVTDRIGSEKIFKVVHQTGSLALTIGANF